MTTASSLGRFQNPDPVLCRFGTVAPKHDLRFVQMLLNVQWYHNGKPSFPHVIIHETYATYRLYRNTVQGFQPNTSVLVFTLNPQRLLLATTTATRGQRQAHRFPNFRHFRSAPLFDPFRGDKRTAVLMIIIAGTVAIMLLLLVLVLLIRHLVETELFEASSFFLPSP